MALRDFSEVPYMPVLSLRPAEMRALEELPNKTKDILLPIVHLRPWTTAHMLENGLVRLHEAYDGRPTIIAIGDAEPTLTPRPVHAELHALRNSAAGYGAWCAFIQERPNFIPAVQLTDPEHLAEQVECFYGLGRGLVVIVERAGLPGLGALSQSIAGETAGGTDTCFVLDLGVGSRDPLQLAVYVVAYCQTIFASCPQATVTISASSFPMDFKTIVDQEIYERTLFDAVAAQMQDARLVYSDRGSARVERQRGGGGQPAPRIDYPLANRWLFYRSASEGFAGYREQAIALQADNDIFDAQLRVWGTLMIERTANGDTAAIRTPARSTAARINLHLQRQSFYGDPVGLYDTEDAWEG